jgi:hypothetical protein
MSVHPCAQILTNKYTNFRTIVAVNELTVPPLLLLIQIILKITSIVRFMSTKGTTVY